LEARVADKVTTKIFRSNKTQAVRLPKTVAFPGEFTEVEVIAIGSSRLICPVGRRWDTFFSRDATVSAVFLAQRDQGTVEDREPR
jgi:antitoxin VapB